MQMCPDCGKIYDESEGLCPFCHDFDDRETNYIVYDSKLGEALSLSEQEYEEFKRTHPDYQ